jgi:hypothetical protein
VWRGALTGAGASKWFDRGGEKPHQRVKLSLIAQQHPSELDVGLYPAHRHGKLVRGRHGSLFGRVEDALGDADYARYKFVIDLDGDGCSGRLGKLLYLGSVVLKPEWDGWYPFYHKLLRPWVHYVPIADDLSDLLEKLAWLREHDQRARQIAEAGVALARGLLTPRDGYLAALIRGIASTQSSSSPRDAVGSDTFVRVMRADDDPFYKSHGQVDQKQRPVDVHCPASTAPAWMLNISSAAELVRAYYEAAGAEAPPRGGRQRVPKKRPRRASDVF